ncbi:CRISPR-associated Cas3 family helicase [Fluviicoccus keumensis]|uniref:CRISPR-associated Cas3 family helicase n=1 Tax=Fluviicoccus keumensis TaxID=1435465 RepID=A0A4Q7YL04_9GAMM|nr:CRISPR-associated helicase Cas3' [Fluviicoccus keumensis]RZU38237.1 CRISPR-associated Cas3 family helicase [Fluviicoccus keumensis]
MEKKNYFAHSTTNPDKSDWQLLSDHLSAVGELASQFAKEFGCEPYGKVAGLLHDLGKYTQGFQQRINGEGGKVDHATAGAQVAVKLWGPSAYLIAYAIAGHHAGLANGFFCDNQSISDLKARLARTGLEPDPQWQQEVTLPEVLPNPPIRVEKKQLGFQSAFLIRMLFSCLVDADYLDTEAFYLQLEGKASGRGNHPTLALLHQRLQAHLQTMPLQGAINEQRRHILSQAGEKAAEAPGLFSLTVPTGGGKTLTSLSFALQHALRHGMERVIYVIPYTSIVEQNAAVFRQVLGDEAVLEHHSAFHDDGGKPESRAKLRQAMENWDAPLIVTTAVQFFESLFANRPSKCRKLHRIANSVVILDEAQTLPLKFLRPCMAAIDELARNYRSSLVLCTATQPALSEGDFENGFANVREIAPDPEQLYEVLGRVTVKEKGGMSNAEVIDVLCNRPQVLCIVNNRLQARELFDGMAGEPGAYHLTTLMCAKHRSQKLGEIRTMLKAGKPCRLVSTSLIEAGVDVDFPFVLRAEAGLDSIAQAAGRCNREGKRRKEDSEVWIFQSEVAPPQEMRDFVSATREVLRHERFRQDPLSLAAIREYFGLVYWRRESGRDSRLGKNMLDEINNGRLQNQPFEKIASEFRLIDSPLETVIIPFDEAARKAIHALNYADKVGGIARELQLYTVQIPPKVLDALEKVGAVQSVRKEVWGDQFRVLMNEGLYSEHVGLSWDNPVFVESSRLVW